MGVIGIWKFGNAVCAVGLDEFSLSPVPFCKDFNRRCATEDTRMDQSCEAHAGNVSGGTEDALKVPDSLGSVEVQNCELGYILPKTCRLRTIYSRVWVEL